MSGDGHIVPDHEKVLKIGFRGIIDEAKQALQKPLDDEQIDFYHAVIITMEASLSFIKRYGKLATVEAKKVQGKRQSELLKIAEMCQTLLEGKVEHFYEAIEAVYLIHVLQMMESNGHSFCYGRFDQYMYPY